MRHNAMQKSRQYFILQMALREVEIAAVQIARDRCTRI